MASRGGLGVGRGATGAEGVFGAAVVSRGFGLEGGGV